MGLVVDALWTACKLGRLTSFRSRPQEISSGNWAKLGSVYDSVADIDLITGGLAETPMPGAVLGKTLACIIGKQFHALMFADRYFFSHSQGPKHRGMDRELVTELRKRTLRDVLCENTDITTLQKFVMKKPGRNNRESFCSETNTLDFDLLAEHLASADVLVPSPTTYYVLS